MQPIGKLAAAINGWITFNLPPGAGLDIVQHKRAVVAIEFTDKLGNSYKTAARRIVENN
jgi:hypothetical protein